jgi:hypothetical protein
MPEHARPEHEWLHPLAGDWTYDMEADMGPDRPPERQSGTTTLRLLDGGMWLTGEMHMESGDGAPSHSLLTLGWDPRRARYVGTFVAPSVPELWVYDGALDDARRTLTLETEGPSFSDPARRAAFRDRIERLGDDEFLFASSFQGADGTWRDFMTMRHRRRG